MRGGSKLWMALISTMALVLLTTLQHRQEDSLDVRNMNALLKASHRQPKAIFITGGMGNIGKYVVSDLLHRGFHVVSLDVQDLTDQLRHVFEVDKTYIFPASRFKFIQGDIRNLTVLRSILAAQDAFQITGIIHLAAISRVQYCIDDEIECHEINIEGTGTLLQAVASHARKRPWLVFTSSREVYGSNCTRGHPCNEMSLVSPINLYGQTKWKGEELIRNYSSHALKNHAILRLSSVYGGRYDIPERLIPSITREALQNGTISLSGGQQYLDFVHILDVVRSILTAADVLESGKTKCTLGEILICSGTSTAATEIVQYIIEMSETRPTVVIHEADSQYPMSFVCDNRKMTQYLLGHPPIYQSIYKGLERYIQAFSSYKLSVF